VEDEVVDVKDMKDFIKCPGNQFLDTNGTCRYCMEGGCLKTKCPQWAAMEFCSYKFRDPKMNFWFKNHCPISCGMCTEK